MSTFDLLHPALQHHVVNSLGWRSLRPLQEKSIRSIISGHHALMLAPTAGGKTEASLFPIFSRMLFENWTGLSIIYVCPIKALLNNLHDRLEKYTSLIGRRTSVWHGDISATQRKHILADPPDCLLTTPESIEAMLISTRTDNDLLFENLHAVIIDEIHAFAGDDRGWHLLSVLERLIRIAGREIQRIGLSATVGNPESLLEWFSGYCKGDGFVFFEKQSDGLKTNVKLDFVGNLDNAATVISRLHLGNKRLVFCDSRARVEQLAANLRGNGITTFVSHSSLSAEERKRSEEAFSSGKNCVIVATSALELGIDVGSLDHVIQIDSPSTVSAFLQRMGRTGRREGMSRNCLFLATSETALLQTAALIHLWLKGFVEPVIPPVCPYHVFVQQILGLILQERKIGMHSWKRWIGRVPAFSEISDENITQIFQHMFNTGILFSDQSLLWFGVLGEKLFGYKNFMNLCSVFTSLPLFSVKYGNKNIGFVDEITFAAYKNDCVVLLGGNAWLVKTIDRKKRIASVEPTNQKGKSRWLGEGPFLSYELCSAVKQVLTNSNISELWSKRATDKICELRNEYEWISEGSTAISFSKNRFTWWTFAGKIVNVTIASMIKQFLDIDASSDNLSIKLNTLINANDIKKMAAKRVQIDKITDFINIVSHYKFNECLPDDIIHEISQKRYFHDELVDKVLCQDVHIVSLA